MVKNIPSRLRGAIGYFGNNLRSMLAPKTRSNSSDSVSTVKSGTTASSKPVSAPLTDSALTSTLSLNDALTTMSPNHGLTSAQLKELHQGKPICTLALDPKQKTEGTRFLPTSTVYQLVDVDPKQCTPEQAANLFADPKNAPRLMGKQCKDASTQDNLTHYTLTNPLGTYYLDAQVETAPLPDNQPGYQITSSRQNSDLLEKNEGRCMIVPVVVENKPRLLIIRQLEATLLQDPKVMGFSVSVGTVNSNHEEASKSLITNFAQLLKEQAAGAK